MLLRVLRHVPLANGLFFFSSQAHKIAIKKFLILVFCASLPVIFTALYSTRNIDFVNILHNSISVSDQFIYAASFLAPGIYLIWEKHDMNLENSESKSKIKFRLYPGYGWILLISIVLLFVTAVSFTAIKFSKASFEQTILFSIMSEGSIYVYLFSLYAYYMSIVEAIPVDFVGVTRKTESTLQKSFKNRLAARGEANG